MTPTDAQIEAFELAYLTTLYPERHDFVGSRGVQRDAIISGLTAAAEVGERPPGNITDRMLAECLDREKSIIERCAKFAEDYFEMEYEKGYGEMIADAMREALLKDKP